MIRLFDNLSLDVLINMVLTQKNQCTSGVLQLACLPFSCQARAEASVSKKVYSLAIVANLSPISRRHCHCSRHRRHCTAKGRIITHVFIKTYEGIRERRHCLYNYMTRAERRMGTAISGAGARVVRARANGRRFLARTSEGAEPSEKSIVVMALWIFLQPLNVPYTNFFPPALRVG